MHSGHWLRCAFSAAFKDSFVLKKIGSNYLLDQSRTVLILLINRHVASFFHFGVFVGIQLGCTFQFFTELLTYPAPLLNSAGE